MDDYAIGVLTNVGLISFLALSAYLLLVAGEMSFGQQAFFGVGAYAGGMLTAMYGWPLPLAALGAMALGALAQFLVGLPTLRLRGLYFAMATLAAAEMMRILFELFHFQRVVAGEVIGPDGTQGFRGIRWVFENGVEPEGYLALVWALLAVVIALFLIVERSRLGATLRMLGEDATCVERELLTAFPYQANSAILHTDDAVMPRCRRAWAWTACSGTSREEAACSSPSATDRRGRPARRRSCRGRWRRWWTAA